MTIAYVNSGTFAGNNTASIAPGVPSSPVSGNKFVAFVGGKPYNESTGTPTGYTKRASATSGTDVVGNGIGSTYCVVYDHDVTGSESGTVSFTLSPNGDPAMSRIFQFSKSSTMLWDVAATGLADQNNTGDNEIITATGSQIDIKSGDMLVWAATMPNDNDLIASPVMTVPGCTVGSVTQIATDTTALGNDGAIFYYRASVTAGSATGAPVFTAVTGVLAGGGSDPDDTAVPLVRLREVAPNYGGIASTLGGATSSLAGSVSAPSTTGAVASTLGGATASMAGTVLNNGSAASTLGGVTAALAGTTKNNADLASTLGGATASMDGDVLNNATLAATLGGVTAAFEGNLGNSGEIASTLGGVTASFEGEQDIAGDLACTLGGVTCELDGSTAVLGSLAATLGGCTAEMQGTAPHTVTQPLQTGSWAQLQDIYEEARQPQEDDSHKQLLWPDEKERHRPAPPLVIPEMVPNDLWEDPRWGAE